MDIQQKSEQILFNIENENNFERLKKLFKDKKISRFAITENLGDTIQCEYAEIIENSSKYPYKNIFDFKPRKIVNNTNFNAVMIVPTGIGAEVGGDSGDANAAAKLIGNSVDTLITHPNVVNAADINEMTSNTLYVEGSVLNRFMMGTVGLSPTRGNRILLLYDTPDKEYIGNYTINTASAARITLGCDIDVMEIKNPPFYSFFFNDKGMAVGKVENLDRLIDIIQKHKDQYDSIALHTILDGDSQELYDDYFVKDTLEVNIWGGIEAIITHTISNILDVSVAHSPQFNDEMLKYEYPIVNPKKCPETLSKTELFCILKGLYRTPKIVEPLIQPGVFTNNDIHVLITPDRCISLPILAALEQNIKVIVVEDNKNIMKNDLTKLPWNKNQFFKAKNYLEAAGLLVALKSGIDPHSILRPIGPTKIKN
jgi:hypothetical protein